MDVADCEMSEAVCQAVPGQINNDVTDAHTHTHTHTVLKYCVL